MSSSRTGRVLWTWWPVAFMTAIIVFESTVWFGADHTSSFLRTLWQAMFGHVGDARWQIIHHYIRKTGHFIGYGLVGLSWLRAWRRTRPDWTFRNASLLAMLATAITASSDEFHQSFLPNRTSSPWDVLIDCTGAFVLLFIASLFVRVRPPAPRIKQAA